jgi:hypothetical protein
MIFIVVDFTLLLIQHLPYSILKPQSIITQKTTEFFVDAEKFSVSASYKSKIRKYKTSK